MSTQLPIKAKKEGSAYFLKASEDISETPRQFVVSAEPTYGPANDPRYGNEDGNTYTYYWREGENECVLNSTSTRLAFAWNKASLEVGDSFQVTKTGQGFDTQYVVTKIQSANPLMDM